MDWTKLQAHTANALLEQYQSTDTRTLIAISRAIDSLDGEGSLAFGLDGGLDRQAADSAIRQTVALVDRVLEARRANPDTPSWEKGLIEGFLSGRLFG